MVVLTFGARNSVRGPALLVWFVVALSAQVPVRHLVSADPVLRLKALQQLSGLSDQQKRVYVDALIALIRGSNDDEANRCVLAFVKIGSVATPSLLSLCADSSPGRCGRAAQALAMIRPTPPAVISRLRALLSDQDEWVRQRVSESLLSMGVADERAEQIERDLWRPRVPVDVSPSQEPKDTAEAIAWLAGYDDNRCVRCMYAFVYLTRIGVLAVQPLLKAVETGDEATRAGALRVLFDMHLHRADIEAAAIKGVEDASALVRDEAESILTFTVTEAAQDALLREEVADVQRKRVGKHVRAR